MLDTTRVARGPANLPKLRQAARTLVRHLSTADRLPEAQTTPSLCGPSRPGTTFDPRKKLIAAAGSHAPSGTRASGAAYIE
jgi:hypothetical protein